MPTDFMQRSGRGFWMATCLAVALAACLGCGRKTPDVAPVNGKVLLNGQPLTTGSITARPAAGRGAKGVIESDGSFELSTFGNGDGALLGKHEVAVFAYDPTGVHGPESGLGTLLIPQRYTNPDTSGLTIDVKADEDNEPVIELTSP